MLLTRGIQPDRVLSLDVINPGRLMGLAAGIMAAVGGVLSQSLLLILIVAFILVETGAKGQSLSAGGIYEAVARDVRQYLIITSATGLALLGPDLRLHAGPGNRPCPGVGGPGLHHEFRAQHRHGPVAGAARCC